MVVEDRFFKMAHFSACHKCDDATSITDLFFQEIVRLHGVSRTNVSDTNTKFLSHFWRCLWRLVGTKLLFSTTYLPQTNGKMKVTTKTFTTLLRGIVSKSFRDWDVKLPLVEFAYNRSPSYATLILLSRCITALVLSPLLTLFPFLKNQK